MDISNSSLVVNNKAFVARCSSQRGVKVQGKRPESTPKGRLVFKGVGVLLGLRTRAVLERRCSEHWTFQNSPH